jgi:hypothetical protein
LVKDGLIEAVGDVEIEVVTDPGEEEKQTEEDSIQGDGFGERDSEIHAAIHRDFAP